MVKIVYFLIASVLLIIDISLMIGSLSTENWSKVNNSDVMTLAGCKDCDLLQPKWNFECLAKSLCYENSALGSCKVYTNLYHSAYAYLVLEVAALLMALILLEKIVILAFNKDYGSSFSVYLSGSLILVFHLLATTLWFGLSGASPSNCSYTSSLYETPSVCIEDGPKIALANIFLIAMTLGYFFFIFYNRSELHIRKITSLKKILWIRGKFWAYISLLLLSISYIIILASLTTTSWVTQATIQGSLTRCYNCDTVEWLNWECLAGKQCDIDSSSSSCDLYRKLGDSSKAFIGLEIVSIFFLLFFSQSLTALIKGRTYGIGILNFFYPIAAVLANLLASAVWFGMTDCKFNDCKLCGQNGPGLAVASQFFMIPMCAIFLVIYLMKTETFEENKLDTSIAEKGANSTFVHKFSESPIKSNSIIDPNN